MSIRFTSANYWVGAVLLTGLLALGFSVFKLQSIFLAESSRNAQILSERKEGIENYASKLLAETLKEKMRTAESVMPSLLENPLLDDDGYFWQPADGARHLPLDRRFAAKSRFPVQSYYQELSELIDSAGKDRDWDADHALLWDLQQAIAADQEAGVEQSMRQLLAFDASKVDQAGREITYRVVLLELFATYAKASPDLISRLVRDDLVDSKGATIPGLQKLLLSSRPKLQEDEFDFLKNKVLAISRRNQTRTDDFRTRLGAPFELPQLPANNAADLVLSDGRWLLHYGDNDIRGLRLDMASVAASMEVNMQQLGLLGPDDELLVQLPPKRALQIEDIAFAWTSSTWTAAIADLQQFDLIKRSMLIATVVIILAVAFLLWWIYRRQARWVDTKSEFVAAVSHELRTPLSGIRLMAERLATRLDGDPRAKDYPQRIVADIDALSFVADNILSFERLNSGRWVSHKSPVALQEVVANLQQDLPLFTRKPFKVTGAGDPDLQLYADPVLIKLLFTNLAKNSCHYNDRDIAEISIDWAQEDDEVLIDFRDNGIGMPNDELDLCFSAFYRGKQQRHTRGSGLGLALCRKIVTLHGGRITVASSNAEGSHFRLTLERDLESNKNHDS